jgi:hypothetical protein
MNLAHVRVEPPKDDPMSQDAALSRTPPVDVRRQLRRESGFVCAHPDCDEPYLQYHHFDPQWHEEHHHRSEGMLALCPTHHDQADAWDNNTLRRWKNLGPKSEAVRSKVQWTRDNTVFVVGGSIAIGCEILLMVNNEPIIWITTDDDGRSLLNLTLRDRQGNEAFVMRDNDWIAHPAWDDIEVPPKGRSLTIRAEQKGIKMSLHFSEGSIEENIGAIWSDISLRIVPGRHSGIGEERISAAMKDSWTRWTGRIISRGISISDPVLICKVTGNVSFLDLILTDTEYSCGGLSVNGSLHGYSSGLFNINRKEAQKT